MWLTTQLPQFSFYLFRGGDLFLTRIDTIVTVLMQCKLSRQAPHS